MKNELGLIHIYCGNGKGKTTAAIGLALRALGFGFQVVVVQFLKDGNSSELKALKMFPNATVISGKDVAGFSFKMTDDQKQIVKENHNQHLKSAIELCQNEQCDVLILDEVLDAVNLELIDYNMLIEFIKNKSSHIEIIMTGRNPKKELVDLADYISNVTKEKHPYDQGIKARGGIEI
ncbi:cob(I)yrinic acid a,c-diamide adenosyltransferase [Paludicola sp. MB14-C6]|uniref:cob(I)yrinic acid a,c-diamide adenosyltransferase n=1 Tax=Paludihabitans sp. MB14-C6 TaxID=3070656 RepID=UPI0027DC1B2B|nr:cob(I)yrinic acid a,c-diamide adenosyltransferase [Paludicola sp. MB14-C6]WMJ22053.1 cob(I)yrinic acid a,c-diamide adenosyltransferase [Paludicola sp. MB14-C6]